jgi:general secretion pathway protein B
MDAAPVYAPEIPAGQLEGGANVAQTAADRAPAPSAAAPSHASHAHDPLPSAHEDPADQEVLPSISEINLGGTQSLPDMHLDVHVYATGRSDRFVYINGRKYREGSTLAEGPVLERIRRDGVVLNYRGLRFVLPRQ